MILKANANAKINIFLRICGLLPKGYHRLFMLMQEISLCDDITIELKDASDSPVIDIVSEADCPPEKDLCFRAAKAFYESFAIKFPERAGELRDMTITEVKNVPSQAGLGGGSSDAATIIKLLQEYYGFPFAQDELIDMAKVLGADVPFFIVGGSCFCEGIGEVITPIDSLAGLHLLLVKPNQGVPTGPCFQLSDSREKCFDEESYKKQMTDCFVGGNKTPLDRIKQAFNILTNDLQDSALELVPVIGDILSKIEKTAPVYSAMSGSGSCVFGIYDSKEALDNARKTISSELTDCIILESQTL